MKIFFCRSLLLAALCILALCSAHAQLPVVPSGFTVEDAYPSASFTLPVQIVFFPSPDTRKLIVEKGGVVWLITGSGTKLTVPFIDLQQKVLSNQDRGLLSVALDPDFTTNRWVYFLYDVDPDSNGSDNNVNAFSRVERYQVSTSNPNTIDLTTQHILIGSVWSNGIPDISSTGSHTIGCLKFGSDKTLLISTGDASSPFLTDVGGNDAGAFTSGRTDPTENIGAFRSQSVNSLNGKVLRIDKETGLGLPSNPFWDGTGTSDRSKVWLYGFRNPYRFGVRPGTGSTNPSLGQPGSLYIGDVGWVTYEELNIARQGGLNFGWPCKEGPNSQNTDYSNRTSTFTGNTNVLCSAPVNTENPSPKTAPSIYWHHTNGNQSTVSGWTGKCATGGSFYTGTSYPERYRNSYFFGDYTSGWVRSVRFDSLDQLIPGSDTLFIPDASGPVSLEMDPNTGDLHIVAINISRIFRVRYSLSNNNPVINAFVAPQTGQAPLGVTFLASGSHDLDGDSLTFQWAFGTGATSTKADTTFTYLADGIYFATITVTDNRGGSSSQTFQILVGQNFPVASITNPPDSTFFDQNQVISLVAAPNDTSQGAVSYRWDVDLGHEEHIHPSQEVFLSRTVSLPLISANDGQKYYYRIRLSAMRGTLEVKDTVHVFPRLNVRPVSMTFAPTNPTAGAAFTVNARVVSQGEVGSSSGFYRVRDGNTVLITGTLPSILNGDSLTISQSIGPLTSGQHFITFELDPTDTLVETNEFDNEITSSVNVSVAPTADAIANPAVLRDDFNVANSPLAGRLKWQNLTAIPNGGSMAIVNNAIQPTSSGGNGTYGAIAWDSLISGGSEASVTIRQKSGNFTFPFLLLYARMNNKDFATGTGYRLRVTDASGTDVIEINRIGPGYSNDVILSTVQREVNIGDVVTFRVLSNNRTMVALLNGQSVLQVTDTVYTPSQWYFALRAMVNATPARFDDFKVSSQPAIANFLIESAAGGGIAPQIAGAPFAIKITALDANLNPFTSFNGTVDITSTGALLEGGGTSATFVNGVLNSHIVKISNPGTFTLSAIRTGGTETGTSNSFPVSNGPLDHFLVESSAGGPIGPQTAGNSIPVRITARDIFGNTVKDFSGSITIASSSAIISGAGPVDGFVNGVLPLHNVILTTAGSHTLSVTRTGGTESGTSNSFTLTPGALHHFLVQSATGTNIGPQVAGSSFAVKITAQDAFNNTVSGFSGAVTVTSNGNLSAGGGTTASFINGVLASHPITISNTGNFSITATRISGGTETGTSMAFTVQPGPLHHFAVEASGGGSIANKIAGLIFPIRIIAQDSLNNTITTFAGTVNVASTGNLSLGSGTTAAFSNGILTSHNVRINNTGSFTISVTRSGGSESGTSNVFAVTSGPLRKFRVEASAGTPIGTQTANIPFTIRIVAQDSLDNTVTGFTGIVNIFSTGTLSAGGGTSPAFTAGILSSRTVTISNSGNFTISATRIGGTETGTSNQFTVNHGPLHHFTVEAVNGGSIPSQVAGTSFSTKISARDSTENLVTSFSGTVVVTSNGTLTTGSGTTAAFTGGILASHNVSFSSTGNVSLTVTRTSGTEIGTSNTFAITPAPLNTFQIELASGGAIGSQTAGIPFSIRIVARDAFNNVVTSFNGSINLSSNGTFLTGGGSSATFSNGMLASHLVSFRNTGSFTLTATRTGSSESGTSNAFIVNPGPLKTFLIEAIGGGPVGSQVVGIPFTIQIAAKDTFNNTVNSFGGTVNISSAGNLTQGGGSTSSFSNGTLATHSIEFGNAGTFFLTATRTGGTESGSSNSFLVNAHLPIVYYSQGNLSPNQLLSWNSVRAGSGSTPPNFSLGDIFIVQSNHSMTTSAAWSVGGIGRIQIENGGTLAANHLINAAEFQIDNGGTYIHRVISNAINGVSSDIPGTTTRSFGNTSTVNIQRWGNGGTSLVPLPSNTFWGNLVIALQDSINGNWNQSGLLTTVNGTLTIQSTGSPNSSSRSFVLAQDQPYTLSVGNLSITGGSFNVCSGTGAGSSMRLQIGGNYSQSGGVFMSSSLTQAPTIELSGNGTSALTISAGSFLSSNLNWLISSGKNLQLNSSLALSNGRSLTVNGRLDFTSGSVFVTGSGDVTIGSTGSLGITSVDGISSGSSVGHLRISGNRTFNPQANYFFQPSASAASQSTGDGFPSIVNNLTLANPNVTSGLILTNPLTVNGTLSINEGVLRTASQTLTLGPAATLIEAVGKTVIGKVTTARTVGSTGTFSFGNIGVDLTTTGIAPGQTSVTRRTDTVYTQSGKQSITRSFSISPAVNSGLNASVVFRYDDSELNGNSAGTLQLYKSTDNGSSWLNQGGTITPASRTISLSGINSFSLWTAFPPPTSTIILTAPNGGENWQVGSTRTIVWSSSNISNVNIEYRTSPTAGWTNVASGLAASLGSFNWSIPNTPSTQTRVRVMDASNSGAGDTSATDITISAPSPPNLVYTPAVLRDDFNSPDTPLSGRLKWANLTNIPFGGSMAIVNNAIQPTSTGGIGTYGGIVWDTLMRAGSEMSVTIRQKSANYTWPLIFIYAKMNTKDYNTGTGYRLRLTENSGTDVIEIHRVPTGYANYVRLATVSREINAGDTLTFRVLSDNKTLAAVVNGVTVLQTTDSVYMPNQWYFAARAQLNTIPSRFDDFKVTSQPVAPSEPLPVKTFLVESAGGGPVATQTAGTPFALRITARDSLKNIATNFTGTVQITSSGSLLSGNGQTGTFVNGVLASHVVRIGSVGNVTITATRTGGTEFGSSNVFTVVHGPLHHFVVEHASGGSIGQQVAGILTNLRISAQDSLGNTVTAFNGTTQIASTGTLVIGNGTTAAFSNGQLTSHPIMFSTPGTVTVSATRTGGSETGVSSLFTIIPGSVRQFRVEALGGGQISSQSAGVSFPIMISARDTFNNVATSFSSTVNISSSGALGVGGGTTASFTGGLLPSHIVSLNSVGTFTLTATRTGGTETGTSNSFVVSHGPLHHFTVEASTGGAIPIQLVNQPFVIKISAFDSVGNIATGFTGSVDITSTGTLASGMGATANFSNGILANHSVSFSSAGQVTLSATRTGGTEIGTSNQFTVKTLVTYYSQATGDATNLNLWNTNRAGGGSQPSAFSLGDQFVIQSNHTVTANAPWTLIGSGNSILIENGGTLIANSLIQTEHFSIQSGGMYDHRALSVSPNGSSSDLPGFINRSFATGSTVKIGRWANGGSNPAPLPTGITWGNLTIDIVDSLTGAWNWRGNVRQVAGSLSILRTGGASVTRVLVLADSASGSITIGGDLIVGGNSAQGLDFVCCGNSPDSLIVDIGGNVIQNGGNLLCSSPRAVVRFIGGIASANFSRTAGTLNGNNLDWKVAQGKQLSLGTSIQISVGRKFGIEGRLNFASENAYLTGSGNFSIASGGILGITDLAGISAGTASGHIRLTGTRTFDPAASFEFLHTSSVSNQETGDGFPSIVHHLTCSNSNSTAGLSLSQSLTVNGTLYLSGGKIQTNSNIITLGPNASMIEVPGKTVIGNIAVTRTIESSAVEAFGGIGATVAAGTTAPGVTTVTRRTGVPESTLGQNSILRSFDISPAVNTNLNAALTFRYDESELNGLAEPSLQLFRSTDNGTTWSWRGGTADPATNSITLNGIGSFSRWTAFALAQPSIILLAPNGGENWQTGTIQSIQWTTTSVGTVALSYRTSDTASWITIAASIPASSGNYSWTIPGTPSSQARVRIVDVSDSTVSAVSSSTFTISQSGAFMNYGTLQDDFNATDGPLAGRLKWANLQNIPFSGSMGILTNAIQATSTGGIGSYGHIVWDTLMSGGSEMRVIVRQKSNDYSFPLVFLYTRMNSKDFNSAVGYRLRVTEQSGVDGIEFQRVGPGYANSVSLLRGSAEVNVGDTLTLRVLPDNKTMVALINSVPTLQITDSAYLPGQWYFSIRSRVATRPVRLDDFYASARVLGSFTAPQGNVSSKVLLPTEFRLEQNYPNPFNPSTEIRFALPEAAKVRLELFTMLGERIRILVDRELPAGFYTEGLDANGLSTGVYIYRLQAGEYTAIRKLILLR